MPSTSAIQFSILLLLPAIAACGGDDDGGGWQGSTPHVSISGTVAGTPVDLSVTDDAAADLTRVFCKREYLVPDPADPSTWAQATMPEIEVTTRVVVDGIEREYELGFSAADFAKVTDGQALAIVAAVEDVRPATGQAYLEVEWSWEDATGFVTYEGSAVAGTIEIGAIGGTPGEGGVVIPDDTGSFGLWFDATWDDGALAGSFTVACGANEVE